MNRSVAREQAFLMICESGFDCDRTAEEIYDTAMIARDVEEDEYARDCVSGVILHRQEIDDVIAEYSVGWNRQRLSVITAAVLSLSIFEMLYRKDVPLRVSLNEAIELSKKYDDEKARAFVNGILNAVAQRAKTDRPDEN